MLVKLVTPPLVNLDLGKWGVLPDPAVPRSVAAQETADGSRSPVPLSPEIASSAAQLNPLAGEHPITGTGHHSGTALAAEPLVTLATAWNVILPALVWIWLGGAALVALVAGMRIVRFQRMLAGTLPASQHTRAIADDLAKEMGLSQSPDIRVVDSAVAPLVWCAGGRATVILPMRLLGVLDEQQTAMVLAHELAHLRRRDHWVRGLELVVSVLYWWNPLVWWVRRRLHAVEEQCCDAWVAWAYPDRSRDYAECLLKSAELFRGRAPQAALASPFLNAHSLKERIELVLENRSPRTASRVAAIGLALLAAVVIPAGVRGAAEAKDEEPRAASPNSVSLKPRGDAAKKASAIQNPKNETPVAAQEKPRHKAVDRGPEIDAAIARLRKQGAMVREFHPRGDAQYWVQIISDNFDDDDLADVEIVARGSRLIFTSAIHRSHRQAWSGWRRPAGSNS